MEAVKKDWAKAARVYKVNCEDYNYGHSCYKLGNYTFMGKGEVKIDHALAVTYYDKGCELNFADACLHAGKAMKLCRFYFLEIRYHKTEGHT